MSETKPMTPEETVAWLREHTRYVLPKNWQEGLLCPGCNSSADRQKCAWDQGGNCPRHDPHEYDVDPGHYVPHEKYNAAADLIEELLKANAPKEPSPRTVRATAAKQFAFDNRDIIRGKVHTHPEAKALLLQAREKFGFSPKTGSGDIWTRFEQVVRYYDWEQKKLAEKKAN